MASLLDSISSKSVSSKLGAILEIAQFLGHTDLKVKIAELTNELADIKMDTADLKLELSELKTEHAALKDENRELKSNAEREKADPLRWAGVVYRDGDNSPFCPGCYSGKGKRIPLPNHSSGVLHCPACDQRFDIRHEK